MYASSFNVPTELIASFSSETDSTGRTWVTIFPQLAKNFLTRWELRQDGPARHGAASIVLPVVQADGLPAALKLKPVTKESAGEAIGLQTWRGNGIVRLLNHDVDTGTVLLERLDATQPLSNLADDGAALQILAELLARLTAVPAPEGVPQLAEVAADMLAQVPTAIPLLLDPAEQELVRTCAAAVTELLNETGDRLLHWDLHYDNILAGQREPWLAIDPQPLSGDPGFDLLPGLANRWDDVVATGNISRAVLRRFDCLTEVLGLERQRAVGWTLGRVLQNALWDIEDGETNLNAEQVAITAALLNR